MHAAIIALSSFLSLFQQVAHSSAQRYFHQVFSFVQHTCCTLVRMLVTVIRRLDTPRIGLKPLCIQSLRSFYSIASARNVSASSARLRNSPSSNRVICLGHRPIAPILGTRKQMQRRSFWEMKFREQSFQARLSHAYENLNEIFIEREQQENARFHGKNGNRVLYQLYHHCTRMLCVGYSRKIERNKL